jgi:type IV pilus assembly protein PilB
MDVSKELEDTQEEAEELTDEQLAAIADENGEDIPVYHLDVSAADPEAVEALLKETDEKAEEVSLIERPAEGKPAKTVDEKPVKAVDEDGKKPRKAAEEKLPARPVEVERGVRNSFGALAMRRGLINREQLDAALDRQKQSKKKLGAILVELGALSSQQTAEILAEQLHIDFFDVKDYVYDPSIADLVPERLIERYSVLPLRRQGNKLYVVTSDPLDFQAIENIRLATGLSVVPVLGLEEEIKKVIFKYFGSQAAEDALELLSGDEDLAADTGEDLSLSYNDAPIVSLVNTILESAIREQASDIHMEPTPTNMRIRQRIDGVLHQSMTVPKKVQPLVTSRIKIMGKLDIAEKRRPQDGKIKVFVDKREVDIRLSAIPTVYGEKLVMRLLDKTRGIVPIDKLGMTDDEMIRVHRMISSPNGVILLTGPTGSGKTTTLYSMVSEINKPDINITTIEDPVEYPLDGLNQVNVNKKAGVTFASALRAFLRQDPDVMVVGEIRDKETAEIAVTAALTGHLVFSTVHTNDAPATVSRLQHMGVEPFLISASITGIISQRLVRTICSKCAEEVDYDEEKLKSIISYMPKSTEHHFKVGRGCAACYQTGYKGRTAIYEVLLVTGVLREAIVAGKDTEDLREIARHEGMKLLVECGMLRAAKGITTIEEVLRVARVEDVTNAEP